MAVDADAAGLVAVDVRWAAALAFALGDAIVVIGSVLIFLTFNANIGVVFTMKSLIVVIMGGVGSRHQHRQLHDPCDGLGAVFRPDTLYFVA